MRPTLSTRAKTPSQCREPGLWNGLVGAWAPILGNQGKTLYNLCNRNTKFTTTGSATWQPDKSILFTGSSADSYSSPSNAIKHGTGNISICFSAKITSFGASNNTCIELTGATDNVIEAVILNNGNIAFSMPDAGVAYSEHYITAGKWYNIAMIFTKGVGVTFYIYDLTTKIITTKIVANTSTPITFSGSSNIGKTINGNMGFAYVYNRVLSADEAKAIITNPFTPFERVRESGYTANNFGAFAGYPPAIRTRRFGYAVKNKSRIIDPSIPLTGHSLNRDRVLWYVSDSKSKGFVWRDLTRHKLDADFSNGPAVWSPSGPRGSTGCRVFDGNNDLVRLGWENTSKHGRFKKNTFSLACWAKYTTTANTVVMEIDGNVGWSAQTWTNGSGTNGSIILLIGYAADGVNVRSIMTNQIYNDGQWHRWLWTFPGIGNGGRVYVDGQNATFVTNSQGALPTYDVGPFDIGSRGGSFAFPGSLEGITMWSRALSSAEAYEEYEESIAGYPNLLNRVGSAGYSFSPDVQKTIKMIRG